ncbi:MAG: hypothetical protein ABFC57_03240 [Veillonellales bacterium]
MTDFDMDRLKRYTEDANKWLLVIIDGLRYPENSQQAAALAMARAASELVEGCRQQLNIQERE